MKLILIRHCQSQGPAPEAGLTEQGLRESEMLVGQLEALGVDAVYASPYARAVSTVMPFVVARGANIRLDPRLRERAVRHIDGHEDWLAHVRRGLEEPDFKLAGEESFGETAARGCAAIAEIAAAGHTRPAIASHGQLLTSVLRASNPAFGYEQWRAMRMPHVFEADWRDGRLTNVVSLT